MSLQRDVLLHLRDELVFLTLNSQDLMKQEFIANETLKRAFTRSLEIIGEAVKNLDNEFITKCPGIEWRSMTGMRDEIRHRCTVHERRVR
jgi:uncharacterized protein with HEPN domain